MAKKSTTEVKTAETPENKEVPETKEDETVKVPESAGVAADAYDPYEIVELKVPRGSHRDDPNLFISVNGVGYLLPKGRTSKVPRYIADEYERSIEAQEAFEDRCDEMANIDQSINAIVPR